VSRGNLPWYVGIFQFLRNGSFRIDCVNTGGAAAVFQVRSRHSADISRTYTVEPQKRLSDTWSVTAIGASDYDLSVYGPNGFLRAFKGGVSGQSRANLDVQALDNEATSGITLAISHQAAQAATVSVLNTYTGKSITEVREPGASVSQHWSLTRFYGWYALVSTVTVEEAPGFAYQFAGHVETGKDHQRSSHGRPRLRMNAQFVRRLRMEW